MKCMYLATYVWCDNLCILQMGPLPKEVLSEKDRCLSEPITRANYLEKLFLLTEWEQHTHMEALEK